jgi:antitoxin component HigA of HigAB toxin-antitoxin module
MKVSAMSSTKTFSLKSMSSFDEGLTRSASPSSLSFVTANRRTPAAPQKPSLAPYSEMTALLTNEVLMQHELTRLVSVPSPEFAQFNRRRIVQEAVALLRQEMEHQALTQYDIADRLGHTSTGSVVRMLHWDKSNMRMESLADLALTMGKRVRLTLVDVDQAEVDQFRHLAGGQ